MKEELLRNYEPNLVDILEGKAERLLNGTGWRLDRIDGFKECLSTSLSGLCFFVPALVPWAIGGDINHVVTVEARDRNKRNRFRVKSNFLDKIGSFFDNFFETILGPIGSILISHKL